MSKFPKVFAGVLLLAFPAFADGYGLGRPADPEEIAAWDIDVRPDGLGLPDGRGDVFTGEEIFAEKCASCHGDFGEAVGRWPVLAGGFDTLTDERPVKTIGSYWPYLSTVFDYVNRAMPFGDAQSLSADEVYAITAYLLFLNDVVDEEFELSHENFADIKLSNEASFFPDDRQEVEIPVFSKAPCMQDCKASAEIVKRAAVLDVTPDETLAKEQEAAVEVAENAQSGEGEAETPAVVEAAAVDPELVAAGEKNFRKCKACHQVGDGAKNRTGPALNGVVGKPAGQIDGFKYSKALSVAADEGLVWDDASLAAFLAKPRAFLKGTKMSFAGVKSEDDIAALIAYLKTFGE